MNAGGGNRACDELGGAPSSTPPCPVTRPQCSRLRVAGRQLTDQTYGRAHRPRGVGQPNVAGRDRRM
eukprot:366119-Chlamydomonas_euryale.AAC.28